MPDQQPPPRGSSETLFPRGDVNPALKPFIDLAVADLASRVGVADSEVEVATAVIVVWPDAALGCPEPGMAYIQVLQEGALIELDVDGSIHRYHAGGTRTPFLCQQVLKEAPPTAS